MSVQPGTTGGASLFTPAYRVSHSGAGLKPATQGRVSDPIAAPSGADYGRAGDDQAAADYGWGEPAADQSGIGYAEPGYAQATGDAAWAGEGEQSCAADSDGGYPWTADEDAGAANPWSDAGLTDWNQPPQPTVSNAVRGFPPAPGESMPAYPPGPFAAWNRSSSDRAGQDRAARRPLADSASQLGTATITPDEFDTNHSIPAIKDPVPSMAARAGSAQRPASQRPASDGPSSQGPASERATRQAATASRGRARGGRAASQGKQARRSGKHQSVWLAIGTAIAIIAVVAVVLVLTTSNGAPISAPKPGGKQPNPVKSSPLPPSGKWEYIGTRGTDSVPLTMHELYPATFVNAGTSYAEVKQAKAGNCRAALIGDALKSAVREGACSQVVRATYVSASAGVMGTVGVFNLKTSSLAAQAATKAGHFNFVAQLQATAGVAKRIGQGTGIEEALVKGHYLVLVWAEYTNLTAPKNQADRTRLESFMNLLIKHTVNVSLSYRMVDGKPLTRPAG